MACSRLSLQSLPWNIIQMTIDIIMRGDQLGHSSTKLEQLRFVNSCLPLLGVSRSWRAMALKYLCREYSIHLDSSTNSIATEFTLWAEPMRHKHSDFYCLINSMTVSARSKDIFSGKAFMQLYGLKCAVGSFGSVKSLNVILLDCVNDDLSDMPVALKHAKHFVAFVKQLMPLVNSVQIEYDGEMESHNSVSCRAFKRLLGGLYSGADTRHLTLVNSGFLLPAASTTALSLTKIETTWDTCFDETIELIRMSNATLQELEVSCAQSTKLSKILERRNEDSQLLVYPNMRVLHLSSGNITRYRCKLFPQNYAPFPRLEKLSLDLVYPFSDDLQNI
ncbi:hypothetical protein GGI20_002635 [Coemansia sp. BCRC 34301]|nr:hypothetical protein GGI20_002635 [Coemansia sp. BCRC 34301]